MTHGQVFPPLVIRARDLACGRGGTTLNAGIDFDLEPGRCLLLRGANGTGKTTLLLTLAGSVRPLGGSFTLDGADEDRVLHYCGHRNAVKPRMSVGENLRFWAVVNGPTGVPPEEALAQVGLENLEYLDAGYLSAGQRQRLALARLLVSLRPLWLLDEPTAALDAQGHALVGQLLDQHLATGGMAIAATHDPIVLAEPERMGTLLLGTGA